MTLYERIRNSAAFSEFLTQVEQKLKQMRPDTADCEAALESERAVLETSSRGWRMSLGDPDLNLDVRRLPEADLAQARQRIQEIDFQLEEMRSSAARCQMSIDPEIVADRLAKLGEILGRENASATNLALARHLDSIRCFPDGRVVVRTCQLGSLANPSDFLTAIPEMVNEDREMGSDGQAGSARRRTRRQVGDEFGDEADAEHVIDANNFAVDPSRFAGLAPEWFTNDVFKVPRRLSWAEEHAREVAEFRLNTHATMKRTVEHFGKTIPTIREALRYARDVHGINAYGKRVSESTRAFWPRDNAQAVAEFFQQPGATVKGP